MIEITLKFANVTLAAAALNQLNGSQLATASVVETPTPTPGKAKAEKPAVTPVVQAAAEPAATKPSADTAQTVAQEPAVDASPKIDYPTLQKAVFSLVGAVKAKGLDPAEHVLGIAKTFGYANFAAMKEDGPKGAEHFSAALAAVRAKAAELEAA